MSISEDAAKAAADAVEECNLMAAQTLLLVAILDSGSHDVGCDEHLRFIVETLKDG